MKEIHKDEFRFTPLLCVEALKEALRAPCPSRGKAPMEGEVGLTPAPKIRLTDGAYS